MSVINTMLRNLDERRAGAPADVTMMGEVFVPPSVRVPPLRATIVVIPLLVGLLVLGTLYFWPRGRVAYLPKPVVIDAPTLPVTESVTKTAAASSPPPVPQIQASADTLQAADTKADAREAPAAPHDLLSLATSLEHADSMPAPRNANKSARRALADSAPRGVSAPAQQSLPVAVPVVAVTPPSTASSTIRLEPSIQTAAERNLTELQRAAELQRRGALAEAETTLRGILDNDRSMVAARLALFALLSRQQRNDEARQVLKEGVDASPTHPQLVLPYARLLAARNEWSAANDALVPATDALAQDAEYRALSGAVLQRLGRYRQSSIEYRAALRLAPTAGAWWVGLGLSLEGEGKQLEARNAYLQARANSLGPDLGQFVDNKLARLGPAD
jgi:MSHA biogenesis protein MshN